MSQSPFKFLDSYTKEDRDIFFGRDQEIEELQIELSKVRKFENENVELKEKT